MYSSRLAGNIVVLANNYSNTESNVTAPVVLDYDYLGVTDFSQGGVVSGIIKTKGMAQDNATVDLFESMSNVLVSTTKTNGAGYFEFQNLNKNYEFFIVVRGLPEWEWRVKSRFKPV